MILAVFVSLYSKCCSPSACIEKNKTLLRMAETGVSITVLVIGILIDLHAMPGSQICGYIVTIAGGVWSVGNVIVIAISTSRQTPTATKKKMLPTEKELRSNKGRHQKTSPKNNSLPGGSTQARTLSRPSKDSLNEGDESKSSGMSEEGGDDEDSVESTSNRGGAAGGSNQVASERGEDSEEVDSDEGSKGGGLPEEKCTSKAHLASMIRKAKNLFETDFAEEWLPRIPGDAANQIKTQVLEDFDSVLEMPKLTVQQRYDRLREMYAAVPTVFGIVKNSHSSYPVLSIKSFVSTFNMALHVLVHSQLGDYCLLRPLKIASCPIPTHRTTMVEPPQPPALYHAYGTRDEQEEAIKVWQNAKARYREWEENLAKQQKFDKLNIQWEKDYKVWQFRSQLQTLVKSIVSQMREGVTPSEDALKEIVQLKDKIFNTLNIAAERRPDDSTWLLGQFGIVLKQYTQRDLDQSVLVAENGYWNIVVARDTMQEMIFVKAQDSFYTINNEVTQDSYSTFDNCNAALIERRIRENAYSAVYIPKRESNINAFK